MIYKLYNKTNHVELVTTSEPYDVIIIKKPTINEDISIRVSNILIDLDLVLYSLTKRQLRKLYYNIFSNVSVNDEFMRKIYTTLQRKRKEASK